MTKTGKILSVNVSEVKGTIKTPRDVITLNETGILEDAHSGNWHRQISLLGKESFDKFITQNNRPTKFGEFAENLTTEGLDLLSTSVLDRIEVGQCVLEITQHGKKCHGDSCAIYQEVGNCVMPKEGIFARVVKGGKIHKGDTFTYIPREYNIHIITVSDRASTGEYTDRSGPEANRMITAFFSHTKWHAKTHTHLVPDDTSKIKNAVKTALDNKADVIFTLGGTGVGPRDITPEAIRPFMAIELPGIMEHVRQKYGANKPNALLSRSVAGMNGTTQIYALPGSIKAVKEYLTEIFKTTEHLTIMAHGIDGH